MDEIKLVVFDMAGTTVKDDKEVETCFYNAALKSGLEASRERIRELEGYPKKEVIRMLWKEKAGEDQANLDQAAATTDHLFRAILENHYRLNPVEPVEGAVDIFKWLRAEGVKIALTTGFYRKVADIILKGLGWHEGLDENYIGSETSLIDLCLTPDEVGAGRPKPDMILKAMEMLGVEKASQVVKVGDAPADLEAGKAAKCLMTIGITTGSHNREQLEKFDNDGIIDNLEELRDVLPAKLKKEQAKS